MYGSNILDKISKQIRSRNMAAIKGTNTVPERTVRKLLRSLGYKYSAHKHNFPGKPDIYVKSRHALIFVNGCFWHQHRGCKYATKPKTNKGFWIKKLNKNIMRDKKYTLELKQLGYKVITIWECEVGKRPLIPNINLERKIVRLLK